MRISSDSHEYLMRISFASHEHFWVFSHENSEHGDACTEFSWDSHETISFSWDSHEAEIFSRVSHTVDFIFFLRKTLFDFIKSCGGRIDLKFSGVALLGLLYSPKWKRSFFSKGKVPFSMAGSLLRAVQESFSVKEIYRWKEDRLVFFYEKKKR